ncbi:MAG: TonB-dependent siderophore receptor [Novosphingobium sp.]
MKEVNFAASALRQGRRVLALTMLGASGLALCAAVAPVAAHAQTNKTYSIPAGSLASVLNRFADQSGADIVYNGSLTDGLSSPGLSGSFGTAEALSRILAGSGLTFRHGGGNRYTLERAPKSADGAISLGPVRVEGATSGSNGTVTSVGGSSDAMATEGVDTYAALGVTLGKSAQTLREIPQSVSVVGRQQMDDQQMTSLAEALQFAPGVMLAERDENRPWMRGDEANIQVEGIAQQRLIDNFAVNDLELFDRVEVLRGPSGLLTGIGTPGGTVNYVRKRPLDHAVVALSARAGSWNNYRGTLDVTGPVNESGSLRARAVVAAQGGDSFVDVVTDQHQSLYGIVEYDFTPSTTLGAYAKREYRKYIQRFWGSGQYTDGTPIGGRSSFIGTNAPSSDEEVEYGIDLTHHFDNGWEAKVVAHRIEQTSDQKYLFVSGAIAEETNLARVGVLHRLFENNLNGLDLRVNGPVHLLGQEHKLTLGWQLNTAKLGIDYGAGTTFYSDVDVLNDHDFTVTPLSGNLTYANSRQSILYGAAHIKLAGNLTTIVGGNMVDYRYDDLKENNRFTSYAGLVWDIRKSLSLYASYAEIFDANFSLDYAGNYLKPRQGWQVEAGVKSSLLNDRLNLALAVFQIRDTGRAMVDTDNVNCSTSTTCYKNAGLVRTRGIDAEITGSPFEGLNIIASYAFNDSKNLNGEDAGERYQPSVTPRHSYKLWGLYRFDKGALDGLSLGGGLRGESSVYVADSVFRQGSWAVASATIGYRLTERLELTALLDNIFDTTYYATLTGAGQNLYGDPRKFAVTLRAKY